MNKLMQVNNWMERHPLLTIAIALSVPFALHAITLVMI